MDAPANLINQSSSSSQTGLPTTNPPPPSRNTTIDHGTDFKAFVDNGGGGGNRRKHSLENSNIDDVAAKYQKDKQQRVKRGQTSPHLGNCLSVFSFKIERQSLVSKCERKNTLIETISTRSL